eukprot:1158040-Pelagomonas_calceolata.AAC.2
MVLATSTGVAGSHESASSLSRYAHVSLVSDTFTFQAQTSLKHRQQALHEQGAFNASQMV